MRDATFDEVIGGRPLGQGHPVPEQQERCSLCGAVMVRYSERSFEHRGAITKIISEAYAQQLISGRFAV